MLFWSTEYWSIAPSDTICLQENMVFPDMNFNSQDQCCIKMEERNLVRPCFAKQSYKSDLFEKAAYISSKAICS